MGFRGGCIWDIHCDEDYFIHDKIGALTIHNDFPPTTYSSMSAAWYNYAYAVRHFMCFYNHLKKL